jgi:hypothetical protein
MRMMTHMGGLLREGIWKLKTAKQGLGFPQYKRRKERSAFMRICNILCVDTVCILNKVS